MKDPDFELHRYPGASILLAGQNFGCGSSREHAAWALEDYGFRVVIAPSFGDIFRTNAVNTGLAPIALPAERIAELRRTRRRAQRADRRPGDAGDHDTPTACASRSSSTRTRRRRSCTASTTSRARCSAKATSTNTSRNTVAGMTLALCVLDRLRDTRVGSKAGVSYCEGRSWMQRTRLGVMTVVVLVFFGIVAATAGSNHGNRVDIRDDCSPATFNADPPDGPGLGPNTCVRDGQYDVRELRGATSGEWREGERQRRRLGVQARRHEARVGRVILTSPQPGWRVPHVHGGSALRRRLCRAAERQSSTSHRCPSALRSCRTARPQSCSPRPVCPPEGRARCRRSHRARTCSSA